MLQIEKILESMPYGKTKPIKVKAYITLTSKP